MERQQAKNWLLRGWAAGVGLRAGYAAGEGAAGLREGCGGGAAYAAWAWAAWGAARAAGLRGLLRGMRLRGWAAGAAREIDKLLTYFI